MGGELIRLDNKHISVDQMTMSVDRVLHCYIHNMFGPPSPLIENYLREAGFWHVVTIGKGCKLGPKLISVLIERWRPETHTFHHPCRECTITLEDVHLQLGVPVDGCAVIGPASSTDWGAVCYELLVAIPDNINGGRIEIGWLRDTFPEPDNDLTELKRIRYARAYILEMIEGYLMPDLSRNLVHLRWLLKLIDFRAAGELSWGSTVLATLYNEMCRATRPNKAKIGACEGPIGELCYRGNAPVRLSIAAIWIPTTDSRGTRGVL
ncbi:protein MAINTENANCE OF MERISTEMS-like [Gossypium arboreum]|uniref:protein MAINTENANCE OF MERISTEMS-like n=1 Tax=Gossypium arboreum TaxID=29729 RepID=UPI0022F1DA93|nr:protein MAINTENANCE OF MERISTEMS-like [Gossypium arboreum]